MLQVQSLVGTCGWDDMARSHLTNFALQQKIVLTVLNTAGVSRSNMAYATPLPLPTKFWKAQQAHPSACAWPETQGTLVLPNVELKIVFITLYHADLCWVCWGCTSVTQDCTVCRHKGHLCSKLCKPWQTSSGVCMIQQVDAGL